MCPGYSAIFILILGPPKVRMNFGRNSFYYPNVAWCNDCPGMYPEHYYELFPEDFYFPTDFESVRNLVSYLIITFVRSN